MKAPLSVVEVVEPGEGGVFRHVEGLVRYLLSKGVRVHLAYSDRRGSRSLLALVEQVKQAGGEVLNLRVTNIPEFADAPALWRLRKFVGRIKPDIVHGHSSKAGVLVRLATCFGLGQTVIYTPHAYYGMSRESKRKRLVYSLVESALGRVGTTINISKAEADFGHRSLKVPLKRQAIIANPVDTDRFRPASPAEKEQARARLGLKPGEVAIGLIARMCWQKDPETAYKAFLEIAPRFPQLRFLHVGWGKWKDHLLGMARERGLENRVTIFDYMENPLDFYHGIDALLISSRYEAGWPFVVLEALACDLPIIGATCPGMENFGSAGLSHVHAFAPEQTSECAAGISAWAQQAGEPPVPCNHRAYALEHFSTDVCFGGVLKLYRSKSARSSEERPISAS